MKLRTDVYCKKITNFSSLMSFLLLVHPTQASESVEDYLELPLEDLLSMEVTSVSKKKQRLNEVAAAVFVITQDDIRRSGVTSIPEALRMAPGIHVARINANTWAISSRGFNNQFANKLLVMIDGRTVYSPTFSGVYWDAQDTLMDDIERIEVIRGPGATVWGANAVNGVINVITRHAANTQGGLLVAGAGNEEKSFASLRYGVEIGPQTHARWYLKLNDRDSSYASGLDNGGDEWHSLRGGFRIDSQATETDNWTLQGDVYDADENLTSLTWKDPTEPDNARFAPSFLETNVADEVDSSGWNLLGKWNHRFSDHSDATLQLFYDHVERTESLIKQKHNTLDIDFQHQFQAFGNHDIIWGLGYRRIENSYDNTFMLSFLPDRRKTNLYNAFIQDEIELVPHTLHLTLGSKFEHNDFTGNEVQPSVRLSWQADEYNTLWGSVSRAVRTPSDVASGSKTTFRIVPLPPPVNALVIDLFGNESLRAETLLAYEAGYRFQPTGNFSFDLSLFYNDYKNLHGFQEIITPGFMPALIFDNQLSAHSYGLELALDWSPLEWWRLQSNYSFLTVKGLQRGLSINTNESSPRHQISLRSMMDLGNNLAFDLWVYSVDDLKDTSVSLDIPVPSYTSLNARLAWRPKKNLELSLVGQNLFDSHHMEFVAENFIIQNEVERSIYGQIRWEF